MIQRDGQICRYCSCELVRPPGRSTKHDSRRLTVDHLVPRARGGTDKFNNLGLACATCNQRKDTMSEWEYLSSQRLRARKRTIEEERARAESPGSG